VPATQWETSFEGERIDHGTGQFNERCIQESLNEALGAAHDNAIRDALGVVVDGAALKDKNVT
jgi:hypothetical protein